MLTLAGPVDETTCRALDTVAADHLGCAPAARSVSQARSASRTRSSGSRVSAFTSVASTSATRPASSPTASRASSAWRARIGTGSRPETSASSGSTSWRTRLRKNRGSSFIGSWAGVSARAAHSARVSDLRRASSGRLSGSPIPAAPGTPDPRRRFMSTVSAWSSAVWPVSTPGGSTSLRASRALASRFGPSATGASTRCAAAPSSAAVRTTRAASPADSGRRPWSTCQAVTASPASTASTNRASESGPPDTAQSTVEPAGGNVQRASSAGTPPSLRGPPSLMGPPGPWTPSGRPTGPGR